MKALLKFKHGGYLLLVGMGNLKDAKHSVNCHPNQNSFYNRVAMSLALKSDVLSRRRLTHPRQNFNPEEEIVVPEVLMI